MKIYDHKKIEKKWQKEWEKKKIYQTSDDIKKSKFYILDMFPYPSGEGLHVGHPRGYIGTDIYSRYKRMKGCNVLHPMGWDAFGLPAEQFAIKNKIHPEVAVKKNIKRYKEQLSMIGFDYDWSREINTTDPEYYKWTQWCFLKFYEKGLAYESSEPINWCSVCKTGLANEDLEGNTCERCGTVVEKRPMRQWVLKITDYAERLLDDLNDLNWPESIKISQRNWIGKSEGSEIDFKIKNSELKIKVFTTRADTLFGATYLVLAPEHKLIEDLRSEIINFKEVKKYIHESENKSEIERMSEDKAKTGIKLEGVSAVNPVNGEEIPVWVADYVLGHYGTGAIMAVPAHDERDFSFAQKYNIPIKEVVVPERIDKRNPPITGKNKIERQNVQVVVRNPKDGKILYLRSDKHNWNTFPMGGIEKGEDVLEAGIREVLEETGYKNLTNGKILGGQVRAEYFASHKDENRISYTTLVSFDLIDEEKEEVSKKEKDEHKPRWADLKDLTTTFMVHAEMDIWLEKIAGKIGTFKDEGVLINSGKFNGMESVKAQKEITEFVGGKITTKYKLQDWTFSRQRYWGEPIPLIHCEKCGIVPVPEKDLPVLLPKVKSYEVSETGESPLAKIESFVNTTCPKCGGEAKRETNTMPQWAGSSWYYLRYIDPENKKVFVDKDKEKYFSPVDFYVGGTEHATRHLIYVRFWHKVLFDLGFVNYKEPFLKLKNQGLIIASDGRKMSKRWGNVVNPDEMVKTYGADTLRVYEMFMGPFDQMVAWNTESVMGARRFIEKIWRLQEKVSKEKSNPEIKKLLHKTIKKVTDDIENMSYNTAISSMMILAGAMEKEEKINENDYKNLLQILAPFAPYITEEIWFELGNKKNIHLSDWPEHDKNIIIDDKFIIVIQINGKVRTEIEINADETEEEIKNKTLQNDIVKNWLKLSQGEGSPGQKTGLGTEDKEIKKFIYIKNRLVNIVTG
ncbi:MAG: leucine--tRNA ligase [Candidatus Paceibacterota bacterium]